MPSHPPQWTDFLSCSNCIKEFSIDPNRFPVTLLCGHSICQECIGQVQQTGCQYDVNTTTPDLSTLGVNFALVQLVIHQSNPGVSSAGFRPPDPRQLVLKFGANYPNYTKCCQLVENVAIHLQDIKGGILPHESDLTKPMLRKLVTLVQSQSALEEGRLRALRSCRAIGERASTELILAHQNPSTLSGNLWTAVRARGCQFLGPAMQEEALKLILLALEDGSELSRKVLVMFVVQKLQQQFPQASKTSIGHVVQLLYRASCFVVKKRDGDSSLMKLKEIYRTYSALRREHDAQVVQIAREAGLRIAPDQWSALLYGDQGHKSHMQSVIDRLQSGESLQRCIQDLENAIGSSETSNLKNLIPHFDVLAKISAENSTTQDNQKNDWMFVIGCLQSVNYIVQELIVFSKTHTHSELWQDEESSAQTAKFKTSFCRDIKSKGRCPRGSSCTFAHTEEELHHHRNKRKKAGLGFSAHRDILEPGTTTPTPPNVNDSPQREMKIEFQQDRISNVTPIAPVRPRLSSTNHPSYYYPQSVPSNYQQPMPMNQQPMPMNQQPMPMNQQPMPMNQQRMPVNQPPVPPHRSASPHIQAPVPPQSFRPPAYGYDPYRPQHMGMEGGYNQPSNNNPYAYGAAHNQQYQQVPNKPMTMDNSTLQQMRSHNEQISVNSGSGYEQNLPHFTVTLSFQSKPSNEQLATGQQVLMGQQQALQRPIASATVNQSMRESMVTSQPVNNRDMEPIPSMQPDSFHRIRNQYECQPVAAQYMASGQRTILAPSGATNQRIDQVPSPQSYPMHSTMVPKNGGIPGFYPIQPQHGSPDENVQANDIHVMIPLEHTPMYRVQTPVYQPPAVQNRDPRVAVVAPQPVIPHPPPSVTPTHLYDLNTNVVFPNNLPQQHHPMGLNVASPYMMAPAMHLSNLPTNPPVLIPVVPVTQYQVIDQPQIHMPSQPNPPVDRSTPAGTPEMAVPNSIENATVQQLEKRKGQILDKLIHNQFQKKEDIPPATTEKLFDVWNCRSYSPLLHSVQQLTAVTVLPETQSEDYATNVIDVIAEIDTGTKQITMRGKNDINPSHARNERTLDDKKMHRMLVEKNDDNMKNAESSETCQPLRALIHYSSGPHEEEYNDDEMIPFSDRPTVSKYGPIARSVRTRPSNTEMVRVNANADVHTNPVAASNEVSNQKQTEAMSFGRNVYSSFENMHAVSYFPASFPRSRESLSTQNAKNHPNIPAVTTGAMSYKNLSLSQAASNSNLLRREETAIHQNKTQNCTEDLRLAMELQQIELEIHDKKQRQQNQ